MNKALAAGFMVVLILSACSGMASPEEILPSLYIPSPPAPTSSAADPASSVMAKTPTAPGPAGLECQAESGQVVPYEIPWNDELLVGRVYTPPCYDADGEKDYPTLYMLHGATQTDQQWDDLGLDEMADTLISRGEIPPLIIIMPREATWVVLPENQFGDRLIKVVIPWIDSHYRTLDDREFRAVGGMSRGGNWAVRLGLLHWGLFGNIGAHSAPLFRGDLSRLPGWAEIIPESKTPDLMLDIGQDDTNRAEAEAFHQSLLDLGIPHQWRLYPGLHDEIYWKAHLEEYLKWYSAGWTGG